MRRVVFAIVLIFVLFAFGSNGEYYYEEYLTQLADDLSPVLGANLDCNGYNLVTDTDDISLLSGADISLIANLGNNRISINASNLYVTGGATPTLDLRGTGAGYIAVTETSSTPDHEVRIYASSTGCKIGAFSAHDCLIAAGGAEKARVTTNGNFVITGDEIGITGDTNLLGLAANALTVNGTIGCGAITSSGAISDGAASSFTTGTTIGTLTFADGGSITDSGGTIDFGDEYLKTSNTLQGNVFYGNYYYHSPADSDTGIVFGDNLFYFVAAGSTTLSILQGSAGPQFKPGVTVNEDQDTNCDFLVKGDTDVDLFRVDTSADKVGVGTKTPSKKLDVDGDISLEAGSGNYYSNDGSQGLSATYTFGGGGSGDIASMTFKNGILTAVTTVP